MLQSKKVAESFTVDVQYVFFKRKFHFIKVRTSHKKIVEITDLPDHCAAEAFTPQTRLQKVVDTFLKQFFGELKTCYKSEPVLPYSSKSSHDLVFKKWKYKYWIQTNFTQTSHLLVSLTNS